MANPTKIKVHELAKELNTTSKKLIERLAEINILKNNMSSLDENEIEALYKHIGLRLPDNKNKEQTNTAQDNKNIKKPVSAKISSAKAPQKKSFADRTKPHIIRTTIIQHESDGYDARTGRNNKSGYVRDERGDTSGLRMGYIRDTFKADTEKKKFAQFSQRARANKKVTDDDVAKTVSAKTARAKDKQIAKPVGSTFDVAGVPETVETMKSKPSVIPEAIQEVIPATVPVAVPETIQPAVSVVHTPIKAESHEVKSVTPTVTVPGIRVAKPETPEAAGLVGTTGAAERTAAIPDMSTATEVPTESAILGSDTHVHAEPVTPGATKSTGATKSEPATKPVTPDATKSEPVEPAEIVKIETQQEQIPEAAEKKTISISSDEAISIQVEKLEAKPTGKYDEPENKSVSIQVGGVLTDDASKAAVHVPESIVSANIVESAEKTEKPDKQKETEKSTVESKSQYKKPEGKSEQRENVEIRPHREIVSKASDKRIDKRTDKKPELRAEGRQIDKWSEDKFAARQDRSGQDRTGYDRSGQGRSGQDRAGYDRSGYGSRTQKAKPAEIPAISVIEDNGSARNEEKRAYLYKDKKSRKQRKDEEVAKANIIPERRIPIVKQGRIAISEKKGVKEVLDENFILDAFYTEDKTKIKKSQRSKRTGKSTIVPEPPKPVIQTVKINDTVSVKDLSEALKKTSAEVIKTLLRMGLLVTLNEEIDFDTASIVADEFGIKAEKMAEVNEEEILFDEEDDPNDPGAISRPPVVVVMGHVDHGKTSLLDAIRKTEVTNTEAGGITQHIGAYMVKARGRDITFLDTPGHEAFTAMRARGAQVTDVAILVVAADDGIMPQTIEAINHAKAANVTIIVAINKVDKPEANPERIKQQLTEYGLLTEEWGGDTICVNVSAKNGTNIDQLLEMVLLVADMQELKSNPNKQAKGTVIEARLDKGRGAVATVLVQRGTLKVGDPIITGTTVGHIRAMTDDRGNNIKTAGPSTPVEILGLPDVPEAGEVFYAITDDKTARQLAEKRKLKQREQELGKNTVVTLEDLFDQINEGKVKELNIIVKADVQGSVEAVQQSVGKLTNDEVHVRIIHGGVGAITESDVTLASVSNAIIIGFNVRPGANASEMAKDAGVDIRMYRVIYNAIEDIEAAMKGMLDPEFREKVIGRAEIRQIFKVSGMGTIGGCHVTDGKVTRNSNIRLIRDGIVVHEGIIASLKRFKDDAKEVLQGYECGIMVDRYNDIKEGDIIEAFINEKVERQGV